MNNVNTPETEQLVLNEDFNLFKALSEGDNIDDPYPVYRKLREYDPVFYMKSSAGFLSENMWIITKYGDINNVLASKKFGRGTAVVANANSRKVNSLTELKQNWVTFLDPPYHTRVRGFINKTFTPRLVNNFKPQITSTVNFLIDCFEDDGEFEMKSDFSYPMAAIVIAELLGIPAEDRNLIRGWANRLVKILDGVSFGFSTEEIQKVYEAADEIKDYFEKVVADKIAAPKDDLISQMLNSVINEDKLSPLEVAATAVLLIIDAHESTKNLIGNGMFALLNNPDQHELLMKNPKLAENAVEEFLRYDSPAQFTGRKALEDFELRDKLIKKNSQVVCMLGAGNRDEEEYVNADTLDISRKNINPLSFGGGIHYCAGSILSRLEAKICFNVLLERLPGLSLKDDEEYHYEKTYHGRGLTSLDLKF